MLRHMTFSCRNKPYCFVCIGYIFSSYIRSSQVPKSICQKKLSCKTFRSEKNFIFGNFCTCHFSSCEVTSILWDQNISCFHYLNKMNFIWSVSQWFFKLGLPGQLENCNQNKIKRNATLCQNDVLLKFVSND